MKNDIWTKYRPANILDSSYNSPKGMEDYKNYSIFDSKQANSRQSKISLNNDK